GDTPPTGSDEVTHHLENSEPAARARESPARAAGSFVCSPMRSAARREQQRNQLGPDHVVDRAVVAAMDDSGAVEPEARAHPRVLEGAVRQYPAPRQLFDDVLTGVFAVQPQRIARAVEVRVQIRDGVDAIAASAAATGLSPLVDALVAHRPRVDERLLNQEP